MQEYQHIRHDFEPIYNKESKVLILGSFPSVKSRENQFYYGHPQNRFWKLLAMLTKEEIPETIEEKKELPFKIKWNTPGNNGKPIKRTIVPEVTLQGNTLHFITPCNGCTFRLVQSGNICYEVEITGNTLIIPATFTGMYELQIVSGDIIFYTDVEL